MPLSLAGAINLNMAVLIFIGVIKDTEVDVGLRAEFGRKRTIDVILCLIRMEPVLIEPLKSQHNQFPYGNEIQIPTFCVFELGLEFWHVISIWVWNS